MPSACSPHLLALPLHRSPRHLRGCRSPAHLRARTLLGGRDLGGAQGLLSAPPRRGFPPAPLADHDRGVAAVAGYLAVGLLDPPSARSRSPTSSPSRPSTSPGLPSLPPSSPGRSPRGHGASSSSPPSGDSSSPRRSTRRSASVDGSQKRSTTRRCRTFWPPASTSTTPRTATRRVFPASARNSRRRSTSFGSRSPSCIPSHSARADSSRRCRAWPSDRSDTEAFAQAYASIRRSGGLDQLLLSLAREFLRNAAKHAGALRGSRSEDARLTIVGQTHYLEGANGRWCAPLSLRLEGLCEPPATAADPISLPPSGGGLPTCPARSQDGP